MNSYEAQESSVDLLLTWYDQHQRILPWRAVKAEDLNLYHTVVSEIMLQQTTVTTVLPYFKAFIERWPTFQDLAQASLEEVLHQWQGLGYYRRAKALWESAKLLALSVPQSDKEWKKLPGFGPYTTAAVRSIALREPIIALDGNIKRIMSRYFKEHDDKTISLKAQSFAHTTRSGDVNQALMDVGSSICTPTGPQCTLCPIQTGCLAFQENDVAFYPRVKEKASQPKRYGYAYICLDKDTIALEKREGQGLLRGGLMGVPLSEFYNDFPVPDFTYHVKHTFTHFHLYLCLKIVSFCDLKTPVIWVPVSNLKDYPLPTLMKKVIAFALKNKGIFI